MKRIFSLLLSVAEEIIPFLKHGNRDAWISGTLLIAANCIPIAGVLFFKWNPWFLLILYWAESLIIGIYNILKIFISGLNFKEIRFPRPRVIISAFFSFFFAVHYGGFMLVHGIFLLIFLNKFAGVWARPEVNEFQSVIDVTSASIRGYFINSFKNPVNFFSSEIFAFLAMFVSHGLSFLIYFIGDRSYYSRTPLHYFWMPYKRIILMHITIIIGALLIILSGYENISIFIVWIILKIVMDLRSHLNEHSISRENDNNQR